MSISTHIGDVYVMAITSAQVQQLYVAYLGRAADKEGLDYWLNDLNTVPAVLTLEQLRSNFVNEQTEYTDAYEGLTRTETVSKIYLNLFGRPADATGLAYWTTGDGSVVNVDQLLVAFINGASASDAKVIANKVLVAEVYTSTAGDNYVLADAKTIIADVDNTTGSVTDALALLEDGSLSGIAIPAGVAALKAAVIAEAASVADATAKIDTLTATNDKVVALNAEYNVELNNLDTDADEEVTYEEASVNTLANAKALYAEIAGTSTVADLQTIATADAKALKTQYDALVNTHANAVAEVKAYNAAVAANAAVKAPAPADIAIAEGALDATFTAKPADLATANTAYTTAVSGAEPINSAAELFAAIKDANAATLASIDKAFSGLTHYSEVKTVAVADAAKDALIAAESKAAGVVGEAYVEAAIDAAASAKIVADAQVAETLVNEAQTQVDAHAAIAESASEAQIAVTELAYTVNVTASTSLDPVIGDNAKADLFYFTNTTHTNDFTLTNFNKGDAIYVGEGYTLATGVTTGTTSDAYYIGTNTSVKEVFFTQNATTGVVSAVIEGNAVGHTAGTGTTDNVTVITLSGVTSLTDVSFANGIITSNHVAA